MAISPLHRAHSSKSLQPLRPHRIQALRPKRRRNPWPRNPVTGRFFTKREAQNYAGALRLMLTNAYDTAGEFGWEAADELWREKGLPIRYLEHLAFQAEKAVRPR